MKLQSVSIHGFRSIKNLTDLPIRTPTLLTGHNDAGKSATLDAVRFLLNKYPPNDRDMTYLDTEDNCSSGAPAVEPEQTNNLGTDRVSETSVEGRFELTVLEQSDLGLPSSVLIRRRFPAGGSAVFEVRSEQPTDKRLRSLNDKKVDELKSIIAELGLTTEKQTKPFLVAALEDAANQADKEWVWEAAQPAVVKALPTVLRFEPAGQNDAEHSIKNALQAAYDAHAGEAELKGKISTLELELQEKLTKDAANIRQHIMDRCSDIGEVSIIGSSRFPGNGLLR